MKWLGGGALAAGLLVFLGFAAGPSSTPSAFAQSCGDDEEHCVIITALADGDEEFSFNDGDIELGAGESEAMNVELDGSLTVTEDEADGWVVQGIDCNNDEFAEVDLDAASVTLDFSDFDDEDEPLTIECVFANVEEAAAGAADAADNDADAADDDTDADDEADVDTADDDSDAGDTADDEGDDADEANVADDDDTTPTSTTTTSGANAQTTATPSETPMIILGNTGNPTGNPSSAQTPTAPQSSQQAQTQARSISPPSTGSGGLK